MARATKLGFRKTLVLTLGASLAASVALAPSVASADTVSPTGKGIAGGALLGAEAVVTIEAIAGVKPPWAYALGAVVGAAGGGVAGHFAENSSDPHVPLYLLAGGVALVIPATILALNATAYRPPADYQEDKAPSGTEPVADVPRSPAPPAAGDGSPPPGAPTTSPLSPAPAPPPPQSMLRFRFRSPAVQPAPSIALSMVELGGAGVRMGVPAVEVRPMFSAAEMRQFGMAQREEVRVPVFRAVF